MNTDELRAADIETAVEIAAAYVEHEAKLVADGESPDRHSFKMARALLLLDKQNAALREEIDVLTGQHERDERENAELRRVLQDVLYWADGYYGADIIQCRRDTAEARRLLAGEVQDAAE